MRGTGIGFTGAPVPPPGGPPSDGVPPMPATASWATGSKAAGAPKAKDGERASATQGHDSHARLIPAARPGLQANQAANATAGVRCDRDRYDRRQSPCYSSETWSKAIAIPAALLSSSDRPRASARHALGIAPERERRWRNGRNSGVVAAQKKVPGRAKNAYLVLTARVGVPLGPTKS